MKIHKTPTEIPDNIKPISEIEYQNNAGRFDRQLRQSAASVLLKELCDKLTLTESEITEIREQLINSTNDNLNSEE
jgi:hypothetical protein